MWPYRAVGAGSCKRVWAHDVKVGADVMETILDALKAGSENWTAADTALDAGVRRRLQAARDAALRRDPVPGRVSNWWRGTLIEAAYQNLHAAESLIVGLYSAEQVEAEIPEAVARVEAGLGRDDPRRCAALGLLDGSPGDPARRERLAKAVEVGFGASDAEHSRLRSFRNTVLGGATTLALAMLVFVAYVYRNPADVPFCFAPAGERVVCASGSSIASGHDVITVALLGSLGGLLAAILAIKNMQGTSIPYDVPQALALLKLPLGALSAIGALVAIRGGFIPGFSDLDSQPQILAYAFGFGVAQQLLTGLVDRQAQSLLTTAPGKASASNRPERQFTPAPQFAVNDNPAQQLPGDSLHAIGGAPG
jgi:hypothetical protein